VKKARKVCAAFFVFYGLIKIFKNKKRVAKKWTKTVHVAKYNSVEIYKRGVVE